MGKFVVNIAGNFNVTVVAFQEHNFSGGANLEIWLLVMFSSACVRLCST